jgi:Family of unknown function (DUF5678)
MSQATAELIMAEIAALPSEEREKLLAMLNRRSASKQGAPDEAPPSVFIPPFDARDPAPSIRWIEEHRAEFAGQYVALDDDRLVAHGVDPHEVIAAVRASSLNGLFFTLIPPTDAPPFVR